MSTPTKYRREVADKITAAVARGKTLVKACKAVGIPYETARRWDEDNRDNFSDRFDRARMLRTDIWADEIIDLSDQAPGSDMAGVQARKLQVDSRKWLLSKMSSDHVRSVRPSRKGAPGTTTSPANPLQSRGCTPNMRYSCPCPRA